MEAAQVVARVLGGEFEQEPIIYLT
jgi:hypothetical protein